MSDYLSLRKAVEFEALGSYAETPIFFENQAVEERNLDEFIKVFIVTGADSNQLDSGRTTDSIDRGAIMIQVFTPLNNGTTRSRTIVDSLRTTLTNRNLDNGNLSITNVRPIFTQPTSHYHQVNVEARFIFTYRQEV